MKFTTTTELDMFIEREMKHTGCETRVRERLEFYLRGMLDLVRDEGLIIRGSVGAVLIEYIYKNHATHLVVTMKDASLKDLGVDLGIETEDDLVYALIEDIIPACDSLVKFASLVEA